MLTSVISMWKKSNPCNLNPEMAAGTRGLSVSAAVELRFKDYVIQSIPCCSINCCFFIAQLIES